MLRVGAEQPKRRVLGPLWFLYRIFIEFKSIIAILENYNQRYNSFLFSFGKIMLQKYQGTNIGKLGLLDHFSLRPTRTSNIF
jgi:hypothetical protein